MSLKRLILGLAVALFPVLAQAQTTKLNPNVLYQEHYTGAPVPDVLPTLTHVQANTTAAAAAQTTASAAIPAAQKGAASGVAALDSGGNLQAPSASVRGGVLSATAGTNQFQTGVSTGGAPIFAQPSFGNLSGTAASTQLPAATSSVQGAMSLTTAAAQAPVQSVASNTGAVTTAQLYTALAGTTTGTLYPGSNPSGFITSSGAPVQSVAAQTGAITAATLAPLLAGTTSTTLAAGNDTRITGACQQTGCTFTGAITPQTTGGLVGTTAGDNANAGSDGEYPSSSGSSTSMTTATPTNLTTLSLTAGDWDVTGTISITCTGNAISIAIGGVTTSSATQPAFPQSWQMNYGSTAATLGYVSEAIPTTRFLETSPTTVYAVGEQYCGSGTLTGQAFLRARRVR